jgi:hypothetical protein
VIGIEAEDVVGELTLEEARRIGATGADQAPVREAAGAAKRKR